MKKLQLQGNIVTKITVCVDDEQHAFPADIVTSRDWYLPQLVILSHFSHDAYNSTEGKLDPSLRHHPDPITIDTIDLNGKYHQYATGEYYILTNASKLHKDFAAKYNEEYAINQFSR